MAGIDKHSSHHELLLENAALRAEVASLKQKLEGDDSSIIQATPAKLEPLPTSHVHRYSSPGDKIELFMQLFTGRQDVYAQRFVNKRTGKAGYAPVCANEWVEGACQKPKIRCTRCVSRKLLPINKSVIYRHLSGKNQEDVVGIYPMLPDETCRLLVVDFDGPNWQDDMKVFHDHCKRFNLNIALERSRSGNGGHIWFFFEQAVPCALARRLASGLLTAAMEQHYCLSFSSYDRLIPNQDTMPTGGFGNLVALPLQGLARTHGNSEFVDEQFVAYADQWAYLSTIKKIPLPIVEELSHKLNIKVGELGVLAQTEAAPKPWEKQPELLALSENDFPPSVNLVHANGLYLPKQGCSQRALGRVKRLAAFKNPDFYKAQAMRLPTYQKPRIISSAWETDEYICIPRGLEADLIGLLESSGAKVSIENHWEPGRPINVSFLGELRPDQQPAAQALLIHSNGVLSAIPAFGKTVTAAYIIAQRKVNTLILVHTQALMNQWMKALEYFLCIDEQVLLPEKTRGRKKPSPLIGCLGGGKNYLSGIIDIAIIGSLVNDNGVKELVKNYGMAIVDECHHVPAMRFEMVLREVTAQYVYGLSATPIRQDGHHPIIFQQCGPIRYRMDAKEQVHKFSHTLLPRFTRFRKPSGAPENWPITDVYNQLALSKARNNMIVNDVTQAIQQGATPMILTERVAHGKSLTQLLCENLPDTQIFFLSGQGSAKEKRAALQELSNAAKPLAIVATGKYVGEGFDEPRLDTLFIAMPIAWKGTVAQYAGRVHRTYKGKQEVRIYDYVDIHVPVLERMYLKRLSAYSALGYLVQALPTESDQKIGIIFNQQTFLSIFYDDIQQARNEIIIVSPYLSKNRVAQMKRLLMATMAQGTQVAIITRPAQCFPESSRLRITEMLAELEVSNIKIVLRKNIHQKFAIIDRHKVWYGSINLLSYGKSKESIMRFENREIAEELLLSIESKEH